MHDGYDNGENGLSGHVPLHDGVERRSSGGGCSVLSGNGVNTFDRDGINALVSFIAPQDLINTLGQAVPDWTSAACNNN